MNRRWGPVVLRVLALLVVIGLSIYLFTIRNKVQDLQSYGYPGIFLVQLLSSATLILPVPGVLLTTALGAVSNPFWVALAAGSGAALGELSGYLAGFSGQGVAQRSRVYDRVEGWMKKYGEWIILILAFVPNPFFDAAGIIAGAMRMPVTHFLTWCWIGKVLKMMMFAYGGATIARFLPFQ